MTSTNSAEVSRPALIKPVGRTIVVNPDPSPAPGPRRRPPATGIVEAVGNSLIWMEEPICRVGDRVHYPRLIGSTITTDDGEERVLISADDLLAVEVSS